MRGREGDTCMTLLRIYHNHILMHMGLGGKMTPGEAAGISIPDRNRWTAPTGMPGCLPYGPAGTTGIGEQAYSYSSRTGRCPPQPHRQARTPCRSGVPVTGGKSLLGRIPAADTLTGRGYVAWIENTRIQERTPYM